MTSTKDPVLIPWRVQTNYSQTHSEMFSNFNIARPELFNFRVKVHKKIQQLTPYQKG